MILKIILALLASCGSAVLGIWLIDEYRKIRYSHYIRHISARYQDVVSLNKQYIFYYLRSIPTKTHFAETKEEFDCFDFDKNLLILIRRDTGFFDRLLCAADHNKTTLQRYHEELAMCNPAIDRQTAKNNGVEYHQATREEQHLLANIMPAPITEFTLQYTLKYYCPVKKANLEAIKGYSVEDLRQLRKQVNKKWPTQIIYTDIPRRPGMWRLAKIQCVYDTEE